MRALCAWFAAVLCAVPLPAQVVCQGTSPDATFTLTVTLESPLPGSVVVGSDPCPGSLYVRGNAVDSSTNLFDVFFVIDSSGSTFAASGLDIDGDTFLGVGDFLNNNDPGDSVLAAEVLAVRQFVRKLDPDRVRVSIIEFSAVIPIPPGKPGEQGRIRIVQSLTGNYALVEAALDDILSKGSVGATDYGGAIYKLIEEYTAHAEPTLRQTYAFFISDGKPTFPRYPYDTTEIPDTDWAMQATRDAAARGITINTYEVGNFDDMSTLEAVARETGGLFFPDLDPAGLIFALDNAMLVQVASVTVENLDTGQSRQAVVDPDGRFRARMDLVTGVNHFRVTVVTSGGQPITVVCETNVTIRCLARVVDSPRDRGGSTTREVPRVDRRTGWGDETGSCEPRDAAFWAGLCDLTGGPYPPGVIRAFPEWQAEADRALAPFGVTACGALHPSSPAGACALALREYAALLFNRVSGLLPDHCGAATLCDCSCDCFPRIGDLEYVLGISHGITSIRTSGELVQEVARLIQEAIASGDDDLCRLAEILARQANTWHP